MSTIDKDKAMAYRHMFELTAWKDFREYLMDEKQTAMNKIIASDEEINVNRGVLRCINSIESHLDFVTK